jgi:hypothetical protein
MSDYISGTTRWLGDSADPDTFWSELSRYPSGRGIRLHLRDGGQDNGSFAGTSDVSGEVYAPEPDGMASIWDNDRGSMSNYLRVEIVGFTPAGVAPAPRPASAGRCAHGTHR